MPERDLGIKKLPPDVQNVIRSGFNIVTSSQCVVELVSNSLDANATAIAVRVNFSFHKIQVVDNGCGLMRNDLQHVGRRYMTSKCKTLKDLDGNLRWLGFRGEALASIISMSESVTIESRHRDSAETFKKTFLNGNESDSLEAVGMRPSHGTTVTILNFMHKVKVRQKRVNPDLEMEDIRQAIENVALIHYDVTFSLRNDIDGRLLLQTHKNQSIQQSFFFLLDESVGYTLQEIQVEDGAYRVEAHIAREAFVSKRLQYVYVNKRYLKKCDVQNFVNKTLIHKWLLCRDTDAGDRGLNSFALNGCVKKYPVFIIKISCPYASYDVTMLPDKSLICFKNWRLIESLLKKLIEEFLEKVMNISKLVDATHKGEEIVVIGSPDEEKKMIENVLKRNAEQFGTSQMQFAIRGIPAKRKKRMTQKSKKENERMTIVDQKVIKSVDEKSVGNEIHDVIISTTLKRNSKKVKGDVKEKKVVKKENECKEKINERKKDVVLTKLRETPFTVSKCSQKKNIDFVTTQITTKVKMISKNRRTKIRREGAEQSDDVGFNVDIFKSMHKNQDECDSFLCGVRKSNEEEKIKSFSFKKCSLEIKHRKSHGINSDVEMLNRNEFRQKYRVHQISGNKISNGICNKNFKTTKMHNAMKWCEVVKNKACSRSYKVKTVYDLLRTVVKNKGIPSIKTNNSTMVNFKSQSLQYGKRRTVSNEAYIDGKTKAMIRKPRLVNDEFCSTCKSKKVNRFIFENFKRAKTSFVQTDLKLKDFDRLALKKYRYANVQSDGEYQCQNCFNLLHGFYLNSVKVNNALMEKYDKLVLKDTSVQTDKLEESMERPRSTEMVESINEEQLVRRLQSLNLQEASSVVKKRNLFVDRSGNAVYDFKCAGIFTELNSNALSKRTSFLGDKIQKELLNITSQDNNMKSRDCDAIIENCKDVTCVSKQDNVLKNMDGNHDINYENVSVVFEKSVKSNRTSSDLFSSMSFSEYVNYNYFKLMTVKRDEMNDSRNEKDTPKTKAHHEKTQKEHARSKDEKSEIVMNEHEAELKEKLDFKAISESPSVSKYRESLKDTYCIKYTCVSENPIVLPILEGRAKNRTFIDHEKLEEENDQENAVSHSILAFTIDEKISGENVELKISGGEDAQLKIFDKNTELKLADKNAGFKISGENAEAKTFAKNAESTISGNNAESKISAGNAESKISARNAKSMIPCENSKSITSGENVESKISDENTESRISGENAESKISGENAESKISGENAESKISGENAELKISGENAGLNIAEKNLSLNIKSLENMSIFDNSSLNATNDIEYADVGKVCDRMLDINENSSPTTLVQKHKDTNFISPQEVVYSDINPEKNESNFTQENMIVNFVSVENDTRYQNNERKSLENKNEDDEHDGCISKMFSSLKSKLGDDFKECHKEFEEPIKMGFNVEDFVVKKATRERKLSGNNVKKYQLGEFIIDNEMNEMIAVEEREMARQDDVRSPDIDKEKWVMNTDSLGKIYYVNKQTGMTMYESPMVDRERTSYEVFKRPEFMPKGMSPILHLDRKNPSTCNVYTKMPKSHSKADELTEVKWQKPYYEENMYEAFAAQILMNIQTLKAGEQFAKDDALKIKTGMHQPMNLTKEMLARVEVINQVDKKFIATWIKYDASCKILVLFDQHAVHERIRLERLVKDYQSDSKWRSSVPQRRLTVEMQRSDVLYMIRYRSSLSTLGLSFKTNKTNSSLVDITSFPTCFGNKELEGSDSILDLVSQLIRDEVETLKTTKGSCNRIPHMMMKTISSEACHGAIKFGMELTKTRCQELMMELSTCDTPFQCAHGRPVMTVLTSVEEEHQLTKNKKPSYENLKKFMISNKKRILRSQKKRKEN